MIKIPEFNEEDTAQFSIIKRYRFGDSNDKRTKYSFCKVGLHKEISKEIKNWMSITLEKLKERKIVEYNPSVELEELEFVELEEIKTWEQFIEHGFSGINVGEISLGKEKGNFIGIMIYIKDGNNIWGQIKRVSRTNVLTKKGSYMLYFGKNQFNDLKEEEGIRFDKNFDLFFYSNNKKSFGIIFDKANFKSLFDLWEEDKKKSLENFQKVELFQKSQHVQLIHEITESDRIIQKMLRNPAFEEYLNDLDYSELVLLKEEVPELSFDLDPLKKDFILPIGNEKEAMKDLIKVICGRYNYSLNRKNVIENSGVKKVYKHSSS